MLTAKLGAAQQDARDAKSKAKHQNNELAAAQKALLEKKKVPTYAVWVKLSGSAL